MTTGRWRWFSYRISYQKVGSGCRHGYREMYSCSVFVANGSYRHTIFEEKYHWFSKYDWINYFRKIFLEAVTFINISKIYFILFIYLVILFFAPNLKFKIDTGPFFSRSRRQQKFSHASDLGPCQNMLLEQVKIVL